jgi:hypothetical protein
VKEEESKEMDIDLGMKPELDSPYIMRYQERFEDGEETFVIMNYYNRGFIYIVFFFYWMNNFFS